MTQWSSLDNGAKIKLEIDTGEPSIKDISMLKIKPNTTNNDPKANKQKMIQAALEVFKSNSIPFQPDCTLSQSTKAQKINPSAIITQTKKVSAVSKLMSSNSEKQDFCISMVTRGASKKKNVDNFSKYKQAGNDMQSKNSIVPSTKQTIQIDLLKFSENKDTINTLKSPAVKSNSKSKLMRISHL